MANESTPVTAMSQAGESNAPPAAPTTKEDLYYAAVVAGWLNSKLERDKSILTLSAGGVGLVATLMTTVGPQSRVTLTLYVLAALAFATSLFCIIRILDRNAEHLKHVVRGTADRDVGLARLDRISFWAFVAGAALLGCIGVIAGIDKLGSQTGAQMSKAEPPTKVTREGVAPDKRSYDGIGDMRPPVPQQEPTGTPPAAPAVAPATTPVSPATSPAPTTPTNKQDGSGGAPK